MGCGSMHQLQALCMRLVNAKPNRRDFDAELDEAYAPGLPATSARGSRRLSVVCRVYRHDDGGHRLHGGAPHPRNSVRIALGARRGDILGLLLK